MVGCFSKFRPPSSPLPHGVSPLKPPPYLLAGAGRKGTSVGRRIAHRDLAARRTVESHNEGGGSGPPPPRLEAGRPNIPLARPPALGRSERRCGGSLRLTCRVAGGRKWEGEKQAGRALSEAQRQPTCLFPSLQDECLGGMGKVAVGVLTRSSGGEAAACGPLLVYIPIRWSEEVKTGEDKLKT